jgi:hypothetical protein
MGRSIAAGLPVCRYAPPTLAEAVDRDFSLIESRRVEHHTQWGSIQPFLYGLFWRVRAGFPPAANGPRPKAACAYSSQTPHYALAPASGG